MQWISFDQELQCHTSIHAKWLVWCCILTDVPFNRRSCLQTLSKRFVISIYVMQFSNTSRYFLSFFCSVLFGRMLNLFAKRWYNHNEASRWIMNRLLGNEDLDAIDRNGQGVDVAQLNLQKRVIIYVKLGSLFSEWI